MQFSEVKLCVKLCSARCYRLVQGSVFSAGQCNAIQCSLLLCFLVWCSLVKILALQCSVM